MTDALSDTAFSRRDLLKGGGALIVGFSMAGVPAPILVMSASGPTRMLCAPPL